MNSHYPPDGTALSTYDELTRYAQAFAAGHLNFVLLLGDPGVGKTQVFRHALGESACWLQGNVSAFGLYLKAYAHRDQPLVLDDVDGLDRDSGFVRFLKSMCQTDPVKRLSWDTQAHALKEHEVPSAFTTRSRLVVIANDWKSVSANVRALEDRAQVIVFAPHNDEIHRYAATWFDDKEVLDFVGAQRAALPQLSLRLYVKARELKQAGLDWRQHVLSRLDPTLRAVALLKSDAHYRTEAARVKAFIAAGHGSRSTYFKYAGQLTAAVAGTATPVAKSPFDVRREDA
jgi:hypothetical protein